MFLKRPAAYLLYLAIFGSIWHYIHVSMGQVSKFNLGGRAWCAAGEAMSRFVPIGRDELKQVIREAQESEPHAMTRIPPEYFSNIWPIRRVFWQRLRVLHRLILKHARRARACLDLGGGGGVFAPTLAGCFDEVTLLDLDVTEASVVKRIHGLKNLELVQRDATQCDLGQARFDVVVAADVLEHFEDIEKALDPIRRWMAPGGLLVTSLPSENVMYELLRVIFRTKKPEDHYHKAYDVERFMEGQGFERLERRYVPLPLALWPLFFVSAWENQP